MCWQVTEIYDSAATAPSRARRFCAAHLAQKYVLGRSERSLTFAADAALVTNEIMTILIHGGCDPVTFVLTAHHGYLQLSVRGDVLHPDAPEQDARSEEEIRRAAILDALTTHWGTNSSDCGRSVWAILSAPAELVTTFDCSTPVAEAPLADTSLSTARLAWK